MNHIGHSVKNKKKINKWGYEFSTKMKKESCSVIIKSLLVITQSQKGLRMRNVREKFRCKGQKKQ